MSKSPEARLSEKIIQRLTRLKLFAVKLHGSIYSRAGMPDIYAIGGRKCPHCGGEVGGIAIHLETKLPGESPRVLQVETIEKIRTHGAIADVVRSADEAEAIVRGLLP